MLNVDNWMIVGKLCYLCVNDRKRGREAADQTLFKCMLETSGSDKLSLYIYYYINRRRKQWSKDHVPLSVYFVVTFIPWLCIVTINK